MKRFFKKLEDRLWEEYPQDVLSAIVRLLVAITFLLSIASLLQIYLITHLR